MEDYATPPPDDPGEFLEWAERLPPKRMVDMKAIMDGDFSPYDSMGRKLVEMFETNFEKFVARYDKLQISHNAKIQAMDAAKAAQLQAEQPVAQSGKGKKDEKLAELREWLGRYER